MDLFTREIEHQLEYNGQRYELTDEFLVPVVKLFSRAGYMWLLTRSTPHDSDRLFGLCYLEGGHPEMDYVNRAWLEQAMIPVDGVLQPIERDDRFVGEHPLWVYHRAAVVEGRITEDPDVLREIASAPAYA